MKHRPTYTSNFEIWLVIVMGIIVCAMVTPVAIYAKKISFFIIDIGMIAILIGSVIALFKNKQTMKTMRGYRDAFKNYLISKGYTEIYGERIRMDFPMGLGKDYPYTYLVYDPSPRSISFKEITSPVPERYDFYIADDDEPYLCVFDSYLCNVFLFKTHLPQ